MVSKHFASPFEQTKYELQHRFTTKLSPRAFLLNTVQPCNLKASSKTKLPSGFSSWHASPNLKNSYELMLKLDPVSVMKNEVEELKLSSRSRAL